ncbi:hypothetical protein HKX48_005103 [Thoreauomyces humboldtii]|nr:hypothetical protein HKX48_005103 [Thoreauomyces humboldtii]
MDDAYGSKADLFAVAPVRPHVLPPLYIDEQRLRESSGLKEWVKGHVGVRNYRGPPLTGEVVEEDAVSGEEDDETPFSKE